MRIVVLPAGYEFAAGLRIYRDETDLLRPAALAQLLSMMDGVGV